MDRKTISAILISIIFYIGYSQYLSEKYPNYGQKDETTSSSAPENTDTAQPAPVADSKADPSTDVPPKIEAPSQKQIAFLDPSKLTFKSEKRTIQFDQTDGSFKSVVLHDFKETSKGEKHADIARHKLFFQPKIKLGDLKPFVDGYHAERVGDELKMSRREGPWELTHSFSEDVGADYGAVVTASWTNMSDKPLDLTASVLFSQVIEFGKLSGGFLPGMPTARPMITYVDSQDSEHEDVEAYCKEQDEDRRGLAREILLEGMSADIQVIGFDLHYFLNSLEPQTKQVTYQVKSPESGTAERCRMVIELSQKQGLVNPGQTVSLKFKAWLGPKKVDLMQNYDANLVETVDYGWFGFVAAPLLWGINFFHGLTANWGMAIVLLTILLKILFFPLQKQAFASQQKMKEIQPEMTKLKEKFKDDRMQQQQAVMQLMSKHKVNPMKGCFPMLPQIPVFFAFYRVLSTSVELRHAPFVGWIQDLSIADPYYVTPVLMVIAMFFQQKLTPTAGMDKTQERIMLMMPVVFGVMMITFPAGLVLYMLTNAIVSIMQQQWLYKKLAK